MTEQIKPTHLDDADIDFAAGFSGPSGTGKTIASSVLATELGTQRSGNAVAIETLVVQHEGSSHMTEEIEMVIERLERG